MIYLLEDDESIRKLVTYTLQHAGYEAAGLSCPSAFWAAMKRQTPELVLLDIMLPEEDGLSVLKKLRGSALWRELPVVMLTAKNAEYDRVVGLDAGADDYISKPFGMMELLARVRALLRRAAGNGQQGQARQRTPLLTVGDLSLDTEQRVAIRDGRTIDLTAKEYDLIELLMKNPRRVYSRESLMDLVWGYSYAGDYRTVDVHIRRLREANPASPVHIMTKWGVGYYFAGEEQPTA